MMEALDQREQQQPAEQSSSSLQKAWLPENQNTGKGREASPPSNNLRAHCCHHAESRTTTTIPPTITVSDLLTGPISG